MPVASRPTSRDDFEIAIFCALTLEADAVCALFDADWDDEDNPYDKAAGDPNAYSIGAIGRHNVVVAHMGGMGKVSASIVAGNLTKSFPNIKLALAVGITGVIPFRPDGQEIILGDVIISTGIIQYDFGRQLEHGVVRKDTLLDSLGRPNLEIRNILAKLKGIQGYKSITANMMEYLSILQRNEQLDALYTGKTNDKLYKTKYGSIDLGSGCGSTVSRYRLQTSDNPTPVIHFGLLASGDLIMRSSADRDRIANAEGVLGFEMEGAGVWDSFPSVVVIKGACDYADSQKTKIWQRYAAATASACTKSFLRA